MRKKSRSPSSADGHGAAGTLGVIATPFLLHGGIARPSGNAAMEQKTCADDVQGPSNSMTVGALLVSDDRQRHEDDWQSVEMEAATARRGSDMIAELGQRPLVWSGGPWRWRLSVGAKISYPDAAAVVTDQHVASEGEAPNGCLLVFTVTLLPRSAPVVSTYRGASAYPFEFLLQHARAASLSPQSNRCTEHCADGDGCVTADIARHVGATQGCSRAHAPAALKYA